MGAGGFGAPVDVDELAAQFATDAEVDDEIDENGPPPEPSFEGPDWPGDDVPIPLDDGETTDVGETVLTEDEREAVAAKGGKVEQQASTDEDEDEPEPGSDRVWAGKFETPEVLESAYLEVTRGFTQIAQERKAQADQIAQLDAQNQQMQAQMQELVGYLTQQMAETDPDFAEQLAQQQRVDQLVEQRLAPLREQIQQAQPSPEDIAAQQKYAAAQQQAAAFYQANPDIKPNDARDTAVAQSYLRLANAGVPLEYTAEHLQIAREAAENPQFALDLMMAPNAVKVPGGLDRLRAQSGATIAASNGAPGDNGTRPRGPVKQRVDTFVEVSTGGAPAPAAPGGEQLDEFAEAWATYQADRRSKGPLFGSPRG